MKRTLTTLIVAGALALTMTVGAEAAPKLTVSDLAKAVIRLENVAMRLDKGETTFTQMIAEVNEVSKDILLRYAEGIEGDTDLIGNMFCCVAQQARQVYNAIEVAQQLSVKDDKTLRAVLSVQLDTVRLYSFVVQLLLSAELSSK